jgi:hypothetical protein
MRKLANRCALNELRRVQRNAIVLTYNRAQVAPLPRSACGRRFDLKSEIGPCLSILSLIQPQQSKNDIKYLNS